MPLSDIGTADDYELTPAPNGPLSRYTYQPPAPPMDSTSGGFGTIGPYNPSWSERLGAGFANAMDWVRGSENRQGWQNANEISQNVAGLVPGLGQALSGNQAYRSAQEGNVPGAVISAIGAMPIPAARAAAPLEDVLREGAEPIGRAITTQAGTPGILAYHGSPHSFDKFNFDAIGSGEGSQVYGHGLYFSEHPEVAESYRTALTAENNLIDPKGNVVDFDSHDNMSQRMAHSMWANYGSPDAAADEIRGFIQNDPHPTLLPSYQGALDQVNEWKDQGYSVAPKSTSKYQVSIGADPDKFLHFDKPYDEQPDNVKKAFNNLGLKKDMLHGLASDWDIGPEDGGPLTGEHMHDVLTNDLVDRKKIDPEEAAPIAANLLRRAGVPGIKYLDQGSRDLSPFDMSTRIDSLPKDVQAKLPPMKEDAQLHDLHMDLTDESLGDKQYSSVAELDPHKQAAFDKMRAMGIPENAPPPTHNYVLFSDKNINILKKYGLAGAGTAVGLHTLMNHPDADAYQMQEQKD